MDNTHFPPLNLPFDADERAVKRAYAAALKTTRPDDDPAAFQALVNARDRALDWVRRRGPVHRMDPVREAIAAASAGSAAVAEMRVEAVAMDAMPSEAAGAEPVVSAAAAEAAIEARPGPETADAPLGRLVDRLSGPRQTWAKTASTEAAPSAELPTATEPPPVVVDRLPTAKAEPKPAPVVPSYVVPDDPPPEFRDAAPVHRTMPTPPEFRQPPPLVTETAEAARVRHLSLRFLIDFAVRLTAGDDVAEPARWNDLFEAAEELDLAGRLALERTIAIELDETIRLRPWLNPADSLVLAPVMARIDAHFGWSGDVRRLVRMLGEPSGAHPLIFAVERFGDRALKLHRTPGGFPIIAAGDLDAYFGPAGRATIRLYNRSGGNGSVGFSWSWFACLVPTAWLAGIGRPWAAIGLTAFAVTVVLTMFEPIGNIWTANAYITFLATVLLARLGLAAAARPLELASLVRLLEAVDAEMPTLVERRRMIGAARSGLRIPSVLAGLVFLVLVDGYALGLVIEGLGLPSPTVAAMIGPADRTSTSVSFAERLVAQSFIDKARELLESIDQLAVDPALVPKSPRAQKIEALRAEVRRVVTTAPIGDFAPVFDDLRHRIAQLKHRT
ncbi:MAG: hypothetical protein P4L82_12565 [Ancalomicrobiaceae bacterium]|nr:hypothetical protein [Ancalomicrobiaceae bacterium]